MAFVSIASDRRLERPTSPDFDRDGRIPGPDGTAAAQGGHCPWMDHVRITHVRLRAGADWPHICQRLASVVASAPGRAAIELVAIDEQHGVLVARARDRDAIAELDTVLTPGLAELPVDVLPSSIVGETMWSHDPADAWAEVDALDDAARVAHFVRLAIEAGAVWGLGLYGATWARSPAATNREALPLWPTRELAARCVGGAWRSFMPRAIDRDALLEKWLPGMQEDGIVAVVTPTPNDPGVVVEPDALLQALTAAARGNG
jgi:hypothetical protein